MTSTLTLSTLKENLSALKTFFADGETLGFTVPTYLPRKLSALLDKIDTLSTLLDRTNGKGEDGRVKVALVGGFSTGKTSIVASWLSKTKDDMKIGVGESSNEVTVYNPDDTYQIIDTPGLYGHKRDTVGDKEAYKNKTRRYVSEAHVLLYVLDPVNPIKDSHKDELNWLFRQLNMLPRTIFVLSRFDKECDVGDEEEYQERFRTKKDNILERLTQLIGLTAEEAASLPIVAVSAAPDDKPINDWLNGDQAKYEALSHMASLRNAIHAIVENQGGYDALRLKATTSTIRDILFKSLDFAKTQGQKLQEDYAQTEKDVSNALERYSQLPLDIQHDSDRLATQLEEKFINSVRQQMDIYRKKGMWSDSNDTVREKLETAVKGAFRGIARLGESDVKQFVERSYKRMRRIDQTFASIMQKNTLTTLEDFCPQIDQLTEKLAIDTDSGISGWGITGSLIGLFLGPIGWVGAAAGGLWSIRKLFDSSYQEQQQKDAIEAALKKIRPKLSKALHENLNAISTPLCSFCCKKEKELQTIATHINEKKKELTHTRDEIISFCEKNTSLSLNT